MPKQKASTPVLTKEPLLHTTAAAFLFAPNGKLSNLTPTQWHLVRTPAFKAWFGDWENDPKNVSKVIDENGEPLVVYHGTDKKYNEFKLQNTLRSKFGAFSFDKVKAKAFFFTERKDIAQKRGSDVLAVFLNIRKLDDWTFQINDDLFDYLEKTGKETAEEDRWMLLDNTYVVRKIKELHIDGVKFTEIQDDNGLPFREQLKENIFETYAVFYPNQIKLADGTNTTFDAGTPDIRFAAGGSVSTDAFKKWFAESKVADNRGKPLVVYHGSPDLRALRQDNIFKTRDEALLHVTGGQNAYFFTDTYQVAKSYADPHRAFDYQNAEEGIMEFYLSLQNPLILNAGGAIWRKYEAEFDGQKIKGTRNLVKYAHEKGHDGLIVKNVIDFHSGNDKKVKTSTVYTAFYPHQIKLADGTNTTFDAGTPDIRFAAGGSIANYSTLSKQIKKALRQNEAFEILDSDKNINGGTWTEGGCYVLTITLQKILGGTITVFVNKENLPSHFALKIAPDTYLDGNGVSSAGKILKSLHEYDFKNHFSIGVYKPKMDFNGIPKGSTALHNRLFDYLQPLLKNNLAQGGTINNNLMATKTVTEKELENSSAGGALVGNKREGHAIIHNKGTMGGYLTGKLHKNGGIKATIAGSGQPIEMQGGEVVITAPAVDDKKKHEFNGKMMTNRQILSAINVQGGGVAFAEGGEMPKHITCSGKKYTYGGKLMTDKEIVSGCGCKHSLEAGGKVNNGPQFIDYNGQEIMFEPIFKEYFVGDHQFPSLDAAQKYIDKGSPLFAKEINLYRRGAMAAGGSVNDNHEAYEAEKLEYYAKAGIGEKSLKYKRQQEVEGNGATFEFKTLQINGVPYNFIKRYADGWGGKRGPDFQITDGYGNNVSGFYNREKKQNIGIAFNVKSLKELIYKFKTLAEDPNYIVRDGFYFQKSEQSFAAGGTVKEKPFEKLSAEEIIALEMYKAYKPQFRKENIARNIEKDGHFKKTAKEKTEDIIKQLQAHGFINGRNALTPEGVQALKDAKEKYDLSGQLLGLSDSEHNVTKKWIDKINAAYKNKTETTEPKFDENGATGYGKQIFKQTLEKYKPESLQGVNKVRIIVFGADEFYNTKIAESVRQIGLDYLKRSTTAADPKDDKKEIKPLKLSDIPALVKTFMPEAQQKAIVGTVELYGVIERLDTIIRNMPKTYGTEKIPEDEKTCWLHYFFGGSDWYIIEKDMYAEQQQAFGWVILNDDYEMAEMGYISIEELKTVRSKKPPYIGVELDFYFEPTKLGDIKKKIEKKIYGEDKLYTGKTEPLYKVGDKVMANAKGLKLEPIMNRFNEATIKEFTGAYEPGKGYMYDTIISQDLSPRYFWENEIELKSRASGKIEPKTICLDGSIFPKNYDEANRILREIIDKGKMENCAYDITFTDGEVLSGIIDLQPRDFWNGNINPFTWHINTFWPNMAEKGVNYSFVPKEDIEFTKNIVSGKYDLGNPNKTNNEVKIISETITYPNQTEEDLDDIDETWDPETGKKLIQVWKANENDIKQQFGFVSSGAGTGFDLSITFSNGGTGMLDLSRNARVHSYNPGVYENLKQIRTYLLNLVDVYPFELTADQQKALYKLTLQPESFVLVDYDYFTKHLRSLEFKSLVIGTINPKDNHNIEVRLTENGKKFLRPALFQEENRFTGLLSTAVTEEEISYKIFKGFKHNYKNAYELNKAIEEYLDKTPVDMINDDGKSFISYYSGYGGLEKYGADGKGLMYEFFTPTELCKRMWGLAYKYGYKGGKIMEPAVGVGEFLKYAPKQELCTTYEINPYSHKICTILYPKGKHYLKSFETLFIKNNLSIKDKTQGLEKFDLVIGNPPYGAYNSLYKGMGEDKYTKAENWIDYFIFRGLDLLNRDGLLIFIIGTEVATGGTPWLQKEMTKCKALIAEKANLLDAYRLPNGVFDRTDVLTDIIVLQKK